MTNLAPLMSSNSDIWWTPQHVLDLAALVAPIALDPFPRGWQQGDQDGFTSDWIPSPKDGLVWLNPPYSKMSKFALAFASKRPFWQGHDHDHHAIALVPARTDTAWFRQMRAASRAVCFWNGRIKFETPDGAKTTSAPFPSCLFYAGHAPLSFYEAFRSSGWVVIL